MPPTLPIIKYRQGILPPLVLYLSTWFISYLLMLNIVNSTTWNIYSDYLHKIHFLQAAYPTYYSTYQKQSTQTPPPAYQKSVSRLMGPTPIVSPQQAKDYLIVLKEQNKQQEKK